MQNQRAALLQRVLVAEDDDPLRDRMVSLMLELGAPECRGCASVAACVELLHAYRPTLLILDYQLMDGTAIHALGHATELDVWPCIVVVSGAAGASAAFEMALLGARAYVDKPISPAKLRNAIDELAQPAKMVELVARHAVGEVSVHEMQERVRETMLAEALGRAQGNRRAAARLLRVSRQLIQHMLRARAERGSSSSSAP